MLGALPGCPADSQEVTIHFSRGFIKLAYVGGSLHVRVQKPSSGAESSMVWCLGKTHWNTETSRKKSLFLRSSGVVCAHLSSTPPPPAQRDTLGFYNTKQLRVPGALHPLSGLHVCAHAIPLPGMSFSVSKVTGQMPHLP